MILIVDDDRRVLPLLRKVLESHGYETAVAGDGLEAYELLKHGCYECMLLDVNMPKLSGVELLILMQRDGFQVPTIVMASFSDFGEEELKQFPPVFKYLAKPFEMDDMLEAVQACVGK